MKYKVCVYAICKNESKFIDRWVKNLKEADGIYVLDTGSSDDSVSKLKKHGVIVKKETINPWRFDEARNQSLNMVPLDTDICLCIDLDEIIEKGWREALEKIWDSKPTRVHYNYNWSFDEYGNPAVNFYTDKIHKRKGYIWTHPVHEILKYDGEEKIITTDDITVNHYPDSSKSRASYLPLLELSVKEDPLDDRNMHYLGREYMFRGMYNECIDTLIKHLKLKNAIWKDERSASMRFIARSYKALNRFEEAKMWLLKAIKETPYLREPYIELATLYYENGYYKEAIENIETALLIKKRYKNYINEPFCYNEYPYDILSICLYYEKKYAKALYYVNKALEITPLNKRILENKKIMENKISIK